MQSTSKVSISEAPYKPVVDSNLVMLKEGAGMEGHLAWMQDQSREYAGTSYKCQAQYRYEREYKFALL
ncbi:unnamed protein product [Rhizoctonia solani]|uniref:Uncharacterized protein n=1 Tax=Rhizoctonia solani TaxID=456999 RepID=A0A8H3AH35_9AGAM|nr:unnamed protein product [Rhizoctonia solani]